MNLPLPFRQQPGIAGKLRLGFGLLFFLILSLTALWLFSLHLANQAGQTIATCAAIERTVLNMDRLLEKARRLHGDFFLQYGRIGLAEANGQFALPSIRLITEAVAASAELQQMLASTEVGKSLGEHHVDLNLYLASAKRFADTSMASIDLITRLAAPEQGLEPRFDRLLTELRTVSASSAPLVVLGRELRSFVQEYRITRQRHHMQSVFNTLNDLRLQIDAIAALDPTEAHDLHRLAEEVKRTGEEILTVDQAIKNTFNDFNLQASNAQPVAQTLVNRAAIAVHDAQTQVSRAFRTAVILLATVALVAVGAALLISRFIARNISQRITALGDCTAQLQKGNLGVTATEWPADELGQLGRTFNLMSGRIRELVDDLELKIEQRTTQLGESERRFRRIADELPNVGIIGFDRDRRVFFWNRACEQLYGRSRSEAEDKTVEHLIADPTRQDDLRLQLQHWIDDEMPIAGGEARFRHQNGTPVQVFVSYFTVSVSQDHQERYSLHIDLTELKKAQEERAAMEAQLQRGRKMEAIGLMAGGVAHDLNNILSGIVSYPDLMLMQLPPDSPLRKPVLAIRDSGQRAAAVVADLLTVARGVSSERKTCFLATLAREYLASPEHGALLARHPGVICTPRFADDLWSLSCSPVHVKKSLMNLVTNAAEAIEHAGRITLATRNEKLGHAPARQLGLEPGNYVALEVADTGSGIAPADIDHIFEPFYSKKVLGRSGTGLGLAVVWNTMQDHQGAVTVTSSEQGTVFTLLFPAAERNVGAAIAPGETAVARGQGETILIVDDEALQREIAGQSLESLGYRTVACASGEEALVYLADHRVDLVLLDMLMGAGLNGRETYERLLHLHPGQKALIVSGFSEDDEVRQALRLGATGYVQKPYGLKTLSAAVSAALNSRE